MDPPGLRTYLGGAAEDSAARTVFLDTPNTRAIALIGSPSDRCSKCSVIPWKSGPITRPISVVG